MGMYDDFRCDYPIDAPPGIDWQTKDTPAQYLDLYVLGADGILYHEEYDVEDRSDPNAEGLMALCGLMTRVNKRLVPMPEFRGEISFYGQDPTNPDEDREWWEYSALFDDGKLLSIKRVSPALGVVGR